MMIRKADVVRALAGRDEGKLFFVVGTEGEFLLLADGKSRKIDKPKRKKRKHVRKEAVSNSPAAEQIRIGGTVTNNELRRALKDVQQCPAENKEVC